MHVTFIFIETMSHDLLVQVAYLSLMSRLVSLTKLCFAASFIKTSHCSTLKFYISIKINSFFVTQQKTGWMYLDLAAFQDFKVFLLWPHACEDFARGFATEKKKQ